MRSWILIPLVTTVSVPALAAVPSNAGQASASSSVAAPGSDDENEPVPATGNEIIVTSKRIPGEVVVPQAPIQTLDEEDIASYGANSIDELIDAISPQTGSGRGRGDGTPVILVNGQRISSFRELRRIPPEAIRKLEILPEEVALRFGYSPNQRVVNIILKDKYSSATASTEVNVPTSGGYENHELQGGILKIEGQRRYNLSAEINNTSMLTDSERDIVESTAIMPTVSTDPNPADYRSLISQNHDFTLEGTLTQGLGDKGLDGSVTVNGTFEHVSTLSLSGLDTVTLTDPDGASAIRTLPDPLQKRVVSDEAQLGLGFNKALGRWTFSATSDNGFTTADTWTDLKRNTSGLVAAAAAGELEIDGALPTVAGAGVNHTLNKTLTSTNLATLSGTAAELPAGSASVTVKAGYAFSQNMSEASNSQFGQTTLRRGDLSTGVNLSLPLTSKGYDFLGAVGDISLNLSGGIDHLSDFGTLVNWSAGVTWTPFDALTLGASYIVADAAPTLSQLGAPQTFNYNVSVYDYARSQTALVTVINGGNPDLVKERQRDWKISATWKLPFLDRSNLIMEYFRNRSSNVSETFPTLTTAVENAFPGRVVRDASGALISIDERAVTYDEVASSRLRWGINLSGRIGKQSGERGGGMFGAMRPQRPDSGASTENAKDQPKSGDGQAQPGKRPAPASGASDAAKGGNASRAEGGNRREGGPPSRGPGGPGGGGRWNISLYHTWRFTDTVDIAPGVPVMNQLAGNSVTAGGVPRHEITGEGGIFLSGIGFRLKGTWDAPARVNGSGTPDSSNLRFGSTFNLGLRVFVDLSQQQGLMRKAPFLKGARVSFVVDNMLNSRQRVTDGTGATPLAYQRAYLEPQGRVIGIDLRKMF